MDDPPQPPPDPVHLLARHVYEHAEHELRGLLAPPLVDTPDAQARRDRDALVMVASLAPANVAEASLATGYVVQLDQAGYLRRLAAQHAAEPKVAGRLCKQADSMLRLAGSTHAMLLRVQRERRKRQADPVTRAQDARTEQLLLRRSAEAMAQLRAAEVRPAAVPEAGRPDPAPQANRRLNLRLWEACKGAGPPILLPRTFH
jgi:hypothetical protein